VIDLVRKFKPQKLIFERQGVGAGLATVLHDQAEKEGLQLPWAEMKFNSQTAKTIRIQSLEPIFAARRVWFPMSHPVELWGGFKKLYDLLMSFRVDRRPKKCDVLDALSMLIPHAIPPQARRVVTTVRKDFGTFYFPDDEKPEDSFYEPDEIGAITGYM